MAKVNNIIKLLGAKRVNLLRSFFVGRDKMKPITREMIKMYQLNKLGFDFMGYKFNRSEQLSYHHNVIAKRNGGLETIRNGAILVRDTSHDYIHIIERIDPEIFYLITSEMLDENLKGKIDIENLRKIRDLLLYFENDHTHELSKKGKLLIKKEYLTNRIKL